MMSMWSMSKPLDLKLNNNILILSYFTYSFLF